MRTKMSLQGWLTVSKVLLLGIGPLITLLGGLGGYYFSNKIKLSPPKVNIKSITPVMIYKTKVWSIKPDEKVTFMDKGISLVIHIESGSKPITLSRLKLKGKIFISPNMYLGQGGNVGRTIMEVSQEWEERKPYIHVDWTAFIDEEKSSNMLSAFDNKLICFNLIEPIVNGQAEGGWEIPFSDYLGYSDSSKEPSKIRTYPEFKFFFKTAIGQDFPFDIRDEIKNGAIQFFLIAGSQEIIIPYEYFKKPILFKKEYWDKNPIEKMISFDK